MKKLLQAVLLSGVFCGPAHADFSGGYAIGLWNMAANGGTIDTGGAPGSVSLTSNDGGGGANTDFTFTAFEDATITFDWNYSTTDQDGPQWDPFGYLLAGTFTRLSVNAGLDNQNGTVSFSVLNGEVFGFRAHTVDGILGAATTDVTNFTAISAVPLPSSLSLMSCAFGGVLLVQRRRKQNELPQPADG